ncbi:MAG: dimethyl sulfoxide reductase anchor subunit [Desulfobacula sp.]|jgi:anaerobic dimethyl sulfoxide reductase subunit C|uniref:dimethyl sulfoxide reductase anchor subunit family protein n=1 Tax=Desulfobacula sp. TaxID=2593537 RepID=UPI001D389EFC|nr:dimethyl sulfoxide reductase anchor subunit [Desulfobacula sp.]MBT3485843.1 dimethyl sulfoxide reductase anchor subunit [Desulfobacula sp.]MBT3804023.1 dimethyl sulfoxide reductase anchor subunit [Desulfobacula sp.]MBT4023638.1 dimethyl sulfoxide reductase anchor subunit [Desulfobacula sp.]MBT4197694.1 dimethyl sulfoxide reductase anchor subunit [Desulfobacula sp.]
MNNISLIIFTLLIQTSVGIFSTTILNIWINKTGIIDIPLIILSTCLGLLILGLISAMAHLGNPKNAPHAVANMTHSWLSREIVTTNLFAVGILLLWIYTIADLKKGLFFIETVTLIFGISAIFTMSRVYLLKAVPVWDSIATPIDFFGTVLLTGSVVSAILNGFILDKVYEPNLTLLTISSLGLCLKLTALFVTIRVQKQSKNLVWYKSFRDKIDTQTLIYVIRAGLYILGAALFTAADMGMTGHSIFFVFISFGVIMLTEIWNRFCFYDSFCRIGL